MANVLHLRRTLTERPQPGEVSGVRVRHYAGPSDIGVWLELRHRAFAREKVGVRRWEPADFESEFLAKSWWSPERLWFAEVVAPLDRPQEGPEAIGTVCLAERGAGERAQPVVHWLAVLPAWRRRGVGRLLLETLEAACWDAGHRQVFLETHADWAAALRFYQSQGYRPS